MKKITLLALFVAIMFVFKHEASGKSFENSQSDCACNTREVSYNPDFCSLWDNGSFVIESYSHSQKNCKAESLCWDNNSNTMQPCKVCSLGYGSSEGGLGTITCVNLLNVLNTLIVK